MGRGDGTGGDRAVVMGPWSEQARRAGAHVFVADLEHPELDAVDRHHLTRVLRLRAGETVSASDGAGGWRLCAFRDGALQAIGETHRIDRPSPRVTVGFAPTKGDRPEWAVQKLTEAGVDRILVLVTERTVVTWDGERADRHLKRLQVVCRQAAMQSRRVWLPEVPPPQSLESVLADSPAGDQVCLAEPGGGPPSLLYPCVLVGPEGGWSRSERASGVPEVALGSGI